MAPNQQGRAQNALPQAVDAVAAPAAAPGPAMEAAPAVTMPHESSPRDLLIGGAILLVLFVAFLFAKNAFANLLVVQHVQPARANASGWWLFILLASLASGVVLAMVNPARFMVPLIIAPLGVVALLALVLMLLSARN